MKMFDRITIACDHTPEMFQTASALRGVLESFALRVDFHHLIQKRQVLEFFAAPRVSDYTIVVTHGDGGQHLTFSVVDQEDDDYTKPQGWSTVKYQLTPAEILNVVQGQSGSLISMACGGGSQALAAAFLASGYGAYVGTSPGYYDADAGVLFVTGLIYHLMAEDRDYAPRGYTLPEAVERAAAMDADFEMGTRGFRCWTAANISPAQ